MDAFGDDSALFAVAGHRQAANLAYLGLHGLQHRAGGAASIAASDGSLIRVHSGKGTVVDVFDGAQLNDLRGDLALGQVSGIASRVVFGRTAMGQVAVAVAGRFSNGARLRADLLERGRVLQSGTDAEMLLHLIGASSQRTLINQLVDALWKVEGAFTVLLCTEDRLVAVRDPRGFRSLVVGSLAGTTLLATEDASLAMVGGRAERELEPGEMLIIEAGGLKSVSPFAPRPQSACIHALVGLAGEQATVFGVEVGPARVALGERLAREQPCPAAEVVVALPEVGVPAAMGYAQVAGVPFRNGLIAAPSAAKLVEPASPIRDLGARLRWRPQRAAVAERRVVLVASTLVTGSTVARAVRLLREAGALELHLRVASPIIPTSCRYGVGSPVAEQLAMSVHGSLQALAEALDVDTLGFLSVEAMHEVLGQRVDGGSLYCDACFGGPPPLPVGTEDEQLGLFEG